MKVEKDWLQRSIVNRYASLRIVGIGRNVVDPIDIPDSWVVRVNRAGELSSRGPIYRLTRTGWMMTRNLLRQTWGQYAHTTHTFDEMEILIERLLDQQEQDFTDQMKTHLLKAKAYGDFLNAQPKKVNP